MTSVTPQFLAYVTDDGRLSLSRPADFRAYLQALKGEDVEVVVRKRRHQRSQQQNAWIWGVAYPLLAETFGYDAHEHEDLHYALVEKCFGTKWDARLRTMVPQQRSSKLTTKQFSDYMEWLVRWGAEQGVVIPLPDDVDLESAADARVSSAVKGSDR